MRNGNKLFMKTMLETQLKQDYFIKLFYQGNNHEGTGQVVVIHLPVNNYNLLNNAKLGSNSAIKPQDLLASEDRLSIYLPGVENAKSQIEYLKNYFGFNVSQLAAILDVKRPTIYEWLENKEPNRSNQERLDVIYSLFYEGEIGESLRIGTYLYKKIDKSKSLWDLLLEKNIDEVLARKFFSKIKQILLASKKLSANRKAQLKNLEFKPITLEQKKRALRRLMR